MYMYMYTPLMYARLACMYLALFDGVEAGALDPGGVRVELHVPQHHHRAQQQRRRVGLVLTRDVRRCAVNCLKQRTVHAYVAARCQAQSPNQPGTQITEDIAIQIRHHKHVEL